MLAKAMAVQNAPPTNRWPCRPRCRRSAHRPRKPPGPTGGRHGSGFPDGPRRRPGWRGERAALAGGDCWPVLVVLVAGVGRRCRSIGPPGGRAGRAPGPSAQRAGGPPGPSAQQAGGPRPGRDPGALPPTAIVGHPGRATSGPIAAPDPALLEPPARRRRHGYRGSPRTDARPCRCMPPVSTPRTRHRASAS